MGVSSLFPNKEKKKRLVLSRLISIIIEQMIEGLAKNNRLKLMIYNIHGDYGFGLLVDVP